MPENGLPRGFVVPADWPRRVSFRDLIEGSDVSGVDVMNIGKLNGSDVIRATAAIAWVVYRKTEPDLTYDEVLDGRVQLPDEPEAAPPLVTTDS